MLKQVRAHMVATGRPRLEELVEAATGVKLVSIHHDISTVTGVAPSAGRMFGPRLRYELPRVPSTASVYCAPSDVTVPTAVASEWPTESLRSPLKLQR